jgi:hypothetical protein
MRNFLLKVACLFLFGFIFYHAIETNTTTPSFTSLSEQTDLSNPFEKASLSQVLTVDQ